MKHVLRNDFLADSVPPPSHSAAPKKKCFTVLRTCERVVSPSPLSLRVCGARFAFELLALQALAMYITALRSVRLSGAKRYYTAFVFHFMCFFSPAGASRASLKSSPSAPTQDRGKSRSCMCVLWLFLWEVARIFRHFACIAAHTYSFRSYPCNYTR